MSFAFIDFKCSKTLTSKVSIPTLFISKYSSFLNVEKLKLLCFFPFTSKIFTLINFSTPVASTGALGAIKIRYKKKNKK